MASLDLPRPLLSSECPIQAPGQGRCGKEGRQARYERGNPSNQHEGEEQDVDGKPYAADQQESQWPRQLRAH